MWYFTWMLGLSMAVLLAVLNGMWHEAKACALKNDHSEE
jgi:cyd operon protein YbgT